ncbi:MAG: ABC transporter ATP-binding protein [Candidatus Heimdallarchaeota archaeon]|nr:MAG: ABC transporter ATP-binding protein [Candidatus Gerdarchaeota archaeon]RLI71455.1 MAG: ABC transporter ATP-binding protein [Candidatus Gerdarchaeota archaeon]RLI74588.1 MAG: ABC transporter ATP-binding protein [Candidatus Heimdallarchaeota archaeon]
MTQDYIKAVGLVKDYILGATIVRALRDVSFSVRQGEILFLMGPSGSGKTTLVNILGGIDYPTAGQVFYNGNEITKLKPAALTTFRKEKLAYVFQFYSLIPTLTAIENVQLMMELVGFRGKELKQKSEEALQAVGLAERMNNFPSQLSGGERQRVAIARALAKDPEVIILDEPTGQLDQETGIQVIELVRKICKERQKTVILVTHDQSITYLADRVLHLHSGRIIKEEGVNNG